MKGHKQTEETRKKISETMKGKKPKNFETMQKLAWKANEGRKRTNWELEKLSKGHKGIIFSKERRENISKALKGKPLSLINREHLKGERPHTRGLNHWNYKGASSVNKLERLRFQQSVQKQVLERDNYTCRMCGEKGKYLHVDHIQSWADYSELRFNLNNCRTLCRDCHYLITFGKKMPENSKWGIVERRQI